MKQGVRYKDVRGLPRFCALNTKKRFPSFVCVPIMPPMMQASQTVSKEKAPSVGALKGFEIVGRRERLCLENRPKGQRETAMTSIEAIT